MGHSVLYCLIQGRESIWQLLSNRCRMRYTRHTYRKDNKLINSLLIYLRWNKVWVLVAVSAFAIIFYFRLVLKNNLQTMTTKHNATTAQQVSINKRSNNIVLYVLGSLISQGTIVKISQIKNNSFIKYLF